MITAVKRLTADEFFAADLDPGVQLIDGVLVVNEPRPRHAVVAGRILYALLNWIEAGDGRELAVMPIDVPIGERDVYAPDISYYSAARRPADLDAVVDHLPDIAVEIRSPSTWRYDLGRKKTMYEARGLAELWLADHVARTLLVYRRSAPSFPSFDVELELAEGETLTSPLLEGFALAVQRIFDVD